MARLTAKQIEEMKKNILADDKKNDEAMKKLAEGAKLAQAASLAAKKAKSELTKETD